MPVFPIVDGIPILIDDENSVFARADYQSTGGYIGVKFGEEARGLRRFCHRFARALQDNYNAFPPMAECDNIIQQINQEFLSDRVLVIGAGNVRYNFLNIVYTDVALASDLACICDAHSLPFPDECFSGVIAISIFEHVADPKRCAEEIYRVLCKGGHIFASTPFLQPVHMQAHDFTRFSYLGHRRLFRWFDDIESGCAMGPAKALAYLIPHVLMNILPFKGYQRAAHLVGLMIAFPIKQLDRLIGKRVAAYDAAAGVYFWGRKRSSPISDREMIGLYRGGGKQACSQAEFRGGPPLTVRS